MKIDPDNWGIKVQYKSFLSYFVSLKHVRSNSLFPFFAEGLGSQVLLVHKRAGLHQQQQQYQQSYKYRGSLENRGHLVRHPRMG